MEHSSYVDIIVKTFTEMHDDYFAPIYSHKDQLIYASANKSISLGEALKRLKPMVTPFVATINNPIKTRDGYIWHPNYTVYDYVTKFEVTNAGLVIHLTDDFNTLRKSIPTKRVRPTTTDTQPVNVVVKHKHQRSTNPDVPAGYSAITKKPIKRANVGSQQESTQKIIEREGWVDKDVNHFLELVMEEQHINKSRAKQNIILSLERIKAGFVVNG